VFHATRWNSVDGGDAGVAPMTSFPSGTCEDRGKRNADPKGAGGAIFFRTIFVTRARAIMASRKFVGASNVHERRGADRAAHITSFEKLIDGRAAVRRTPVRLNERLKHDPEKCEAVFRKDHAQTKS
jgi:hypothetical protein